MEQIVFAISELAAPLPTLVLCLVAAWDGSAWPHGRVAAAGAAFVAVMVGAGVATGMAGAWSGWGQTALLVAGALLLWRASGLDVLRTLFLLATFSYVSSFLTLVAGVVDALVVGDALSQTYLAWPGMAAQWSLGALAVALLWRFARRGMPELLDSRQVGRGFWRIAWLLPAAACAMLYLLFPETGGTDPAGTSELVSSLATCAFFSVLIALVYAALLRMTREGGRRVAALQELRRLSMQTMQERYLEERMEEAARARHDLRQHDRALRGLADAGDLEGIRRYLRLADERRDGDGERPLVLCPDGALNAVAVYYRDAALRLGTRIEMDLASLSRARARGANSAVVASVLGNLLENAVEALGRQEVGQRWLSARSRASGRGELFLVVENSCDVAPRRDRRGELVSAKRAGTGYGTRSVADAAERSGGTASFSFDGARRAFTASVMLGAGERDL